jgi:transposase
MSAKLILDHVLSMMKKMEVPKFTFVRDLGFYSEHNLELISSNGYKFTILAPSNVGWQKKLIAEGGDTLVRPGRFIEENGNLRQNCLQNHELRSYMAPYLLRPSRKG